MELKFELGDTCDTKFGDVERCEERRSVRSLILDLIVFHHA